MALKAIYPGTFSIFHKGHLSVLQKALQIFDYVYLLVAKNSKKNFDHKTCYLNTLRFFEQNPLPNVEVVFWPGQVVKFAQKHNIKFIIRGIRNEKDFPWENWIAKIYKMQDHNIVMVYFLADEDLQNLSSTTLLKKKLTT